MLLKLVRLVLLLLLRLLLMFGAKRWPGLQEHSAAVDVPATTFDVVIGAKAETKGLSVVAGKTGKG